MLKRHPPEFCNFWSTPSTGFFAITPFTGILEIFTFKTLNFFATFCFFGTYLWLDQTENFLLAILNPCWTPFHFQLGRCQTFYHQLHLRANHFLLFLLDSSVNVSGCTRWWQRWPAKCGTPERRRTPTARRSSRHNKIDGYAQSWFGNFTYFWHFDIISQMTLGNLTQFSFCLLPSLFLVIILKNIKNRINHIVWKWLKMSQLKFCWNFCPIKSELSV